MPTAIDGNHYMRCLAYALKAVPSAETTARLAHVAFVGDTILGADGKRWHAGKLPEISRLDTVVCVARDSAKELMLGLTYARKIAKRHSDQFVVRQEGSHVQVEYGDQKYIEHDFANVDVGFIPESFEEPVPGDAPLLTAIPAQFDCGQLKEAMEWYRSWETDHGTCVFRHAGGMTPLRVDMFCGGDLVAQAFLLPKDQPDAILEDNEPLLQRARETNGAQLGRPRGQSILDLKIMARPERSADETPVKVRKPRKPRAAAPPSSGDGFVENPDEEQIQ